MKKTLKIAFAVLSVVVLTVAAGCDDGEVLSTTPADATTIAGPDGFFEGETAGLTVEKIPYATSYRWYKGGEVIPGATGRTLTVSEIGVYRVAGVNALGEGKASPAKSIRALTFTDRWVGEWDCTEYWVKPGENGAPEELYNNNHKVTIIRTGDLSENKIAIVNFFEANPPGTYSAFATTYVYEGVTYPANGDTIVATVDEENKTMQIPTAWFFTPTWKPGLNTELCPLIYDSGFADNVGEAFPPQQFVEEADGTLKMVMKTGSLVATVGSEQTEYNQTYMIALTSSATGYLTHFARAIGTVWTKTK